MQLSQFRRNLTNLRLLGLTLFLAGAVYAQSAQAETHELESHDSSKTTTSPATLLDGATKIDGLIQLYRNGPHLYAALRPNDFDSDLIVLISIARGIAQKPLFAGATWNFGDDWVCQFRRVGQRVHFVRRNVRYRAEEGSPSARAVELAYSDSILASLPIAAQWANGTVLVDLSGVFLSDLPHITQSLPNFEFSPERS